jgi:alpha-aminoadipate/glutamate carrier protein LysW
MVACPDCEALLDIEEEEVEEGEVINCPDCGVELEVVNVNPIEVERIEEEEEEDDDEEDAGDEDEEEGDDWR